ncbi:GNAT family N-acetyltransferase [Bradyrhizobium sp. JYMT SZCCT0180]|uniref:GNAT family N-acetyltransferase n=1 Tax=Bradyrhizobium sp. JYMT SZCCT0180 TaxID=2807666 RepID=UPI001BA918A3|nr:GNAT family N-acetyltransferase [Bradyrhizobium sp. JYMT SZCCT0180]MBR1212368.1 GNAT family N-acetyltransferase [Bradyrhizobium sp. JYMT SZCCT0180]
MTSARLVNAGDLDALLALFAESDVSRSAEPERARIIWAQILAREGVMIFVSDESSRIVSTCMLITTPNLLRGGRQHGILENVATHPDFQGRGHGRAVVAAALAEAWKQDCYQVLMQSGRADPRVHRFYEVCGFVPGLRTAYAARNPAK